MIYVIPLVLAALLPSVAHGAPEAAQDHVGQAAAPPVQVARRTATADTPTAIAPVTALPDPRPEPPLLAATMAAQAAAGAETPSPTIAPAEAEKPASQPAKPSKPPLIQRAGWVMLAVSVIGGAGGIIFGLGARSRSVEVERRLGLLDPSTNRPPVLTPTAASQLSQLARDGRIYDGLSIAFYVSGGAAAVVTGVLLGISYRGRHDRAKPISISPSLGPQHAGLSATWEF